jgi:hypothetical protein
MSYHSRLSTRGAGAGPRVGAVVAAGIVPVLLLAPVAVVVDRVGPVPVMVATPRWVLPAVYAAGAALLGAAAVIGWSALAGR